MDKTISETTKPLAVDGNIAVWELKPIQENVGVYTVSFEKLNGERDYVSIFSKVGGVELSPQNVLSLAKNDQVFIAAKNENGPYGVTIVSRGADTKVKENGDKVYANKTLKTGAVYHKIDPEGKCYGFQYQGVNFYRENTDNKTHKVIELKPIDCVKLLDGKTITKNGLKAHINLFSSDKKNAQTTEENKGSKVAYLSIQMDNNILESIGKQWRQSAESSGIAV